MHYLLLVFNGALHIDLIVQVLVDELVNHPEIKARLRE